MTEMLSRVKAACWYLGLIFFFSNVVAQMVFVYTRPRTGIPSLGRIYPLNVHGTIVYLTFSEHLIAGLPTFVLAAFFGAAWAFLSNYEKTHK